MQGGGVSFQVFYQHIYLVTINLYFPFLFQALADGFDSVDRDLIGPNEYWIPHMKVSKQPNTGKVVFSDLLNPEGGLPTF